MKARHTALLLTVLCCIAALLSHSGQRETVLRLGLYVGSDWDAPYSDYYKMVDTAIERFEAAHPDVRVEYISGIRQEDYSEWLAAQSLTDRMPDVFFVLDSDFQRYISIGALAELDGYIAADRDFFPDKYYSAAFEAGRMGNTMYALPIQSATTMIFCNWSLLKREGIEMPDQDWTWEDFYSICERVTRKEATGAGQYGCYGYLWEYAVASNGASAVDKAGTECYFEDPRVEQAIRFCRKLYRLSDSYQVTAQDFFDGRVAFRVTNTTDYRMMEYYPFGLLGQQNFEWGCLPMPAGPQGGNISCLETRVAAVSAGSRHKALSWELLKLMSYDPQVQGTLYEGAEGTAVLHIDNWNRSQYTQAAAELRLDAELLDSVMGKAVELPKYETYRQTLAIASGRLEDVFYGDADVSATLMALQREVLAYLKK